jgi:ATP-dependent Clp protease ATP-binding subunit ClpC
LIEKTCVDRSYGARPLRRAIQKNIEDVLSESLILGKLPENGEIEIFVDQERLAFREPIGITH